MMKKILIAVLILAAIGGGIGYYLWNKKPTDVANTKPNFILSAEDLFKAFSTDSANAKKYIGDEKNNRVVQITGTVSETNETDSTTNVYVKADTASATINCSFLTKQSGIKAGDKIAIKGMVSGYMFDDLLGSSVIMDRCVLVK